MIKVDIFDDGNIIAYDNTIADSVMFEKICFNFPTSWNGYAKTAVFRNGEAVISVLLDSDSKLCTGENECYVPYEVIKAPQFTVSVFGVLGDSRATTPQVKIIVRESGYGEGDAPSEPTSSEYEQLLSLATVTKQIAQSVRDDADNGDFKGDKGDIGPQGEKGDKGEPGEVTTSYANNTFANALKSSKSGEAFLIIDDVSPVTHNMGVKISSNTVTDLTAVKVRKLGKNLLPYPYFDSSKSSEGATITVNGDRSISFSGIPTSYVGFVLYKGNALVKSGTFTISVGNLTNVDTSLFIYDSSGATLYTIRTNKNITVNADDYPTAATWNISMSRSASNTEMDGTAYPQIELGTTITEYEPYNGTEYTPNADGTVNGVTSLYPKTILATDTNGIIINCEYNVDSKKYIEHRINAEKSNSLIISLPEKYNLVVGDTFELFWKGVVLANDVYRYNIKTICSIGSCYKRKYMVKPTASGTYPLTVEVYNDFGELLTTAQTSLVISEAATNPENKKNILCVGDSLLSNGQWAYEACRRFTATDGSPVGLGLSNISFIGSRTFNNVGYEGYGGWTFDSYNTANKSTSTVWITTSSDNLVDLSKLGERGTWYYKGKMYTSGNTSTDNSRAIILDVIAGETYYFRQYNVNDLSPAISTNNAMYVTCWDENGNYVEVAQEINVTELTIPDGVTKIAATFICHITSNTDEQLNCNPYISKNPNIPETYVAYGVHTKTEDDQHSVYEDENGTRWKIETIETERIKMIRTSGSTNMPTSGTLTHISGGTDTTDIVFTSFELASGNPFWNETTETVDFKAYAAKLGASAIDCCCVLLGWNSSTWTEEKTKTSVKTFINSLLAAFPDCKIALLGLEIPSLDGCGVNYGCSWNWFDKAKYVFDLNDWYAEIAEEYDNVNFVNIAGQFDTENNMITGTRQVNVRNTKTETYQTNGVHPDTSGYNQIADAVFRYLNSIL